MAYRTLFSLHRMPTEWDGLWWRLGPLGYVEDSHDATARPPKTRTWPGTAVIAAALQVALDDPDRQVRQLALKNATLAMDRATVDRLIRLFDNPAATDRATILRALGATRKTILSLICLEAGLVALIGSVLGLVAGHVVNSVGAWYMDTHFGESLGYSSIEWAFEAGYIVAVVLLAIIAGLVPAMKAYRTPVATNLVAV